MNIIKLYAVRRHTGGELTRDQAKTIGSHPHISVVKAQAAAPLLPEGACSVRFFKATWGSSYCVAVKPVAREIGGSGVAEYVIDTHDSADDLAFYKRVGMRPIDIQRPPRSGDWHGIRPNEVAEGQRRLIVNLDPREYLDPASRSDKELKMLTTPLGCVPGGVFAFGPGYLSSSSDDAKGICYAHGTPGDGRPCLLSLMTSGLPRRGKTAYGLTAGAAGILVLCERGGLDAQPTSITPADRGSADRKALAAGVPPRHDGARPQRAIGGPDAR